MIFQMKTDSLQRYYMLLGVLFLALASKSAAYSADRTQILSDSTASDTVSITCPMLQTKLSSEKKIEGVKQIPTISEDHAAHSAHEPSFFGYAAMELNYGYYFHRQHPVQWDVPHITLGGTLHIKNGWSIVAEIEYERFYEDGTWQNDFASNQATNLFYINKKLSTSLDIRLGILPIPIGLVNRTACLFTIYDPISESAILPMTWHDAGIALQGHWGRWNGFAGLYATGKLPLKRSRITGGILRTEYASDPLTIGGAIYLGNPHEGMYSVDFEPENTIHSECLYALDATYESGGWRMAGSIISSSVQHRQTLGLEVGYDLFSLRNSCH